MINTGVFFKQNTPVITRKATNVAVGGQNGGDTIMIQKLESVYTIFALKYDLIGLCLLGLMFNGPPFSHFMVITIVSYWVLLLFNYMTV